MKRPWELLAAGIVSGELIILAGIPLWAAGAVLTALFVLRFFGPAIPRPVLAGPALLRPLLLKPKPAWLCPAARLFILGMAAGMLRGAAARVPGKEERLLDEWMKGGGSGVEIEFTVDDIQEAGENIRLRSGRLLVTVGKRSFYGALSGPGGAEKAAIGSRVQAFGKLSRFPGATNPGEFDAASWYRAKGMTHRMYADHAVVTEYRESFPGHYLSLFRREAERLVSSLFSPEDAGVLNAALFGDRSGMPEELYEQYKRNGIAHLLAVSGLHTALLGMGLYRLLRSAGAGFLLSGSVSGMFLLIYAALAGGGTSVVRAVSMMLLLFLSSVIGRTYDLRSSAAAVMSMLLILNPFELLQCGFQLSFLAVFSIGGPAEQLCRATEQRFPGLKKRHPRLLSFIRGIISGLCIFFFSLPATAYWFFYVPVLSPLLNLAVIPFMQYVLWAALAAMALASVGAAGPSRAAASVCHHILGYYQALCTAAEKLPFQRVLLGRPAAWQMVLCYLLLLTAYFLLKRVLRKEEGGARRQRVKPDFFRATLHSSVAPVPAVFLRSAITSVRDAFLHSSRAPLLTAVLCITAACVSLRPLRPKDPVLWFLDIGQGDAIAIEYRDSCVLIDGGSSSNLKAGQYILQPFLESRGISHVDTIFITHADADHVNGLTYLLTEDGDLRIDRVVMNAAAENDERYDEVRAACGSRPVRYMGAGERDGMFTCLWPDRQNPPRDLNEQSLVLLFQYGGRRCLFTGDAGTDSEAEILERLMNKEGQAGGSGGGEESFAGPAESGLPVPCPVDVLKAGHHGSSGSTSEEWLKAFPPETAVISCGVRNRYGHPHKETLRRLRDAGAEIRITAEEGALRIVFKEKAK